MKAAGILIAVGVLITGLTGAEPASAHEGAEDDAHTAAKQELEALFAADQSLRNELVELQKTKPATSPEVQAKWAEQQALDADNRRRLEAIVARHGWPGRTQFGAKATQAAFLIVQHADLHYQQKYLPMLWAAAAQNEALPRHVAMLEDRVRIREGRKQIYGSQLRQNAAGEWEPHPLEDEEKIDQRRAEVGLEPLARYLTRHASSHGDRVVAKWAPADAKDNNSLRAEPVP